MACGDHLVAGADTYRQQREMKRGRAIRDRTGMGRAHQGGKLPLKSGNLRALRYPAGQHGLAGGLGFGLLQGLALRSGSRGDSLFFTRHDE